MRKAAAISLILALFCVVGGFAERYSDQGFFLTPSAGFQFGIFQSFPSAAVRADYFFIPLVGAGLDLEGAYGLAYGDAYLNLFANLDLGLIYLGGGFSLRLTNPAAPGITTTEAFLPGVTFGILIPTFRIGPGALSIDVGIDTYLTAIEIDTSNTNNPLAALFAGMAQIMVGVILSPKLDVKIGYTMDL
jgi:hypothetical protein